MSRHGIIDVGSNAIRMLLVEQGPEGDLELARERVALRLGVPVFATGWIDPDTLAAVATTFADFARQFASAKVQTTTAIATAAAREAVNQSELCRAIAAASGIDLQIIDGATEAALLRDTMAAHLPLDQGRLLLLDLGAGSVELVQVTDGQTEAASYPLGSLRLLAAALPQGHPGHGTDFLPRLEAQIEAVIPKIAPTERFAVCGGSLDRMVRRMDEAGQVDHSGSLPRILLADLEQHSQTLALCSLSERIEVHGLEPDRADTLVPAAAVTLNLGRRAGAKEVLVPRIDLKDGIAWRLRQGHAPI